MDPSHLASVFTDNVNQYIIDPATAFFKSSTTEKIACIGPKLIMFVGACIVEIKLSLFLTVILVGINLTTKHPLTTQIARDSLYAVGAAIITTEILMPFGRIVTLAGIGTSFIAVGCFYPKLVSKTKVQHTK